MRRMLFPISLFSTLLATVAAHGAGTSVPISLSNLNVNPVVVVRPFDPATDKLALSAAVSASFDASSEVTTPGTCMAVKTQGRVTGYKRTDTVNRVVVTNEKLEVSATDGVNTVTLAGVNNGLFTGAISAEAEGKTTVSFTANASETVATTSGTVLYTFAVTDSACISALSSTPALTTTTVTKSGTTNGSSSYLVDLQAPFFRFSNTPNGQVQEGASIPFSIKLSAGSAEQPYVVTSEIVDITDLNDIKSVASFEEKGLLPAATNGIARDQQVTLAVAVPCGLDFSRKYALRVTVESSDLVGHAWPAMVRTSYTLVDGNFALNQSNEPDGVFSIMPGVSLSSQAILMSQYPSGDYGIAEFFDVIKAGGGKRANFNTTPGAFHLAEMMKVTSTSNGACAAAASESYHPTTAILTIPAGFTFQLTGQTYTHLWYGVPTAGVAIDLHDPSNAGLVPLPTDLIEAVTPNPDGTTTIKVDLSTLPNLSADTMIYLRAKCTYTEQAVPAESAIFTFTTDDHIDLVNNSLPPESYVTHGIGTTALVRQSGYQLP